MGVSWIILMILINEKGNQFKLAGVNFLGESNF